MRTITPLRDAGPLVEVTWGPAAADALSRRPATLAGRADLLTELRRAGRPHAAESCGWLSLAGMLCDVPHAAVMKLARGGIDLHRFDEAINTRLGTTDVLPDTVMSREHERPPRPLAGLPDVTMPSPVDTAARELCALAGHTYEEFVLVEQVLLVGAQARTWLGRRIGVATEAALHG